MDDKKDFEGVFRKMQSTKLYSGNKDLTILNENEHKFYYNNSNNILEFVHDKDSRFSSMAKDVLHEYNQLCSSHFNAECNHSIEENINEILQAYFDTEIFRAKNFYERKVFTTKSNFSITHFIEEKSLISFRMYKKNLGLFIVCEDIFDVDPNATTQSITEKIFSRWFWMDLINVNKLRYENLSVDRHVDCSIYLSPNMATLLLNLFYQWAMTNTLYLKNRGMNFSKNLNLYLDVRSSFKSIGNKRMIELIESTKIFENGHFQYENAPNKLDHPIYRAFTNLHWNPKELKLEPSEENALDFQNCILIYYSEGNHTFDAKSGDCSFVFQAIYFDDREAVSLLKMPASFNIAHLFQKEFNAIHMKDALWLKMQKSFFLSQDH